MIFQPFQPFQPSQSKKKEYAKQENVHYLYLSTYYKTDREA